MDTLQRIGAAALLAAMATAAEAEPMRVSVTLAFDPAQANAEAIEAVASARLHQLGLPAYPEASAADAPGALRIETVFDGDPAALAVGLAANDPLAFYLAAGSAQRLRAPGAGWSALPPVCESRLARRCSLKRRQLLKATSSPKPPPSLISTIRTA